MKRRLSVQRSVVVVLTVALLVTGWYDPLRLDHVSADPLPDVILSSDSLNAYWPLTEDAGDFNDLQGGNTATASGSPSRISAGPLAEGDEGAVDFPSSSDYLSVADDSDLDLADGPFSIEVWLRRDDDSGATQVALSKGTDAYQVGIDASDRLFFGKVGGAVIVTETGTTPADGSWHHVVVVRTETGTGNTLLYKDGQDVTDEVTPATALADNAATLEIGRGGGSAPFGGALAHLAVYARELDSGEVADHFDAGVDPCPQHSSAIYGTSGNDVLTGTMGRDVICGLSGDDEIYGLGNDDILVGGRGNDHVDGGTGADTIDGGEGVDHLIGDDGDDELFGGGGADEHDGGPGDDRLFGGAANDDVDGGAGRDTLFGEGGIDTLTGGDDDDLIDGGEDGDTLAGDAGSDCLIGRTGADTLTGGDSDDELLGGADHDTIDGGSGVDDIDGGLGNDDLSGAAGNDLLDGGDGSDEVDGGTDNDVCLGAESQVSCESTVNPSTVDSDGDGVVDVWEQLLGTNTSVADTDGDSLSDYYEATAGGYEHVPTDSDSDDDTITDDSEDVDQDGLDAEDEEAAGSDPLTADSDGDGKEDASETSTGTDPTKSDSDGDGLDDAAEAEAGTDPLDMDTDDDTVLDGAELLEWTAAEEGIEVRVSGVGGFHDQIDVTVAEDPEEILSPPGQVGPTYSVQLSDVGVENLDSADIVLEYDDDGVEDETGLRVYTQDEDLGIWMPAATDGDHAIDVESNTITVSVSHFSEFTVVDTEEAADYWSDIDDACWLEDDPDSDGDGLADCEESGGILDAFGREFESDPHDRDTDQDGLDDGVEALRIDLSSIGLHGTDLGDILGAPYVYRVISDPESTNSDLDPEVTSYDRARDLTEHVEITNPRRLDTDGDGLGDSTEMKFAMDPLSRDTDGDGYHDAFEHHSDDGSFNPLMPEIAVTPEQWAGLFAKGAVCGDLAGWCFGDSAGEDAQTIPYLLGSVASSFGGPLVDGRDILGSLLNLDVIGTAANLVGLVPIVGDAAQGIRKIARAFDGLSPAKRADLLAEMTRLDLPFDVQDEVIDIVTGGAVTRLAAHGLQGDAAAELLKGKVDLGELANAVDGAAGHDVRYFIDQWQDGEAALRQLDEFSLPTGHGFADPSVAGSRRNYRIVDAWSPFTKVARESKVGYVKYSSRIEQQILRDADLRDATSFDAVEWHFFPSSHSLSVGADPEVISLLNDNHIPYFIHLPMLPSN